MKKRTTTKKRIRTDVSDIMEQYLDPLMFPDTRTIAKSTALGNGSYKATIICEWRLLSMVPRSEKIEFKTKPDQREDDLCDRVADAILQLARRVYDIEWEARRPR